MAGTEADCREQLTYMITEQVILHDADYANKPATTPATPAKDDKKDSILYFPRP